MVNRQELLTLLCAAEREQHERCTANQSGAPSTSLACWFSPARGGHVRLPNDHA